METSPVTAATPPAPTQLQKIAETSAFLGVILVSLAWCLISKPVVEALKWLGVIRLTAPPVDLRGQVAIVTGASAGIGRSTAAALAANGATVVLAVRSRERGEAARALIEQDLAACARQESGTGALFPRYLAADPATTAPAGKVEVMEVDLSDFASVRAFAQAFLETHASLDILVNNAGIGSDPQRQTTVQGENIVWGTNFVSHFLLTELLLPALKAAPAGRIVNLASVTHHAASSDVLANFDRASRSPYQDSKLAAVLLSLPPFPPQRACPLGARRAGGR